MKNIVIKKFAQEHLEDVCNIEKICFANPWSKQSLAEEIENENSYFIVAEVDGKTAGYMGLQIFSGEGYVTNVAVLPEYRGQGVAQSLITECMKNKMDFITLEVRESNAPARNLYTKMGFEKVGVRPAFYRNPDENAVIMTKYFGEN